MATTVLSNFPSLNELSNYQKDELLSYSMGLIDVASTKKIKECYNYFKDDIMAYLVKTIIQQKIIDTFSNDDVDRINIPKMSLIKQIDKLKPNIIKIDKVDNNNKKNNNSNNLEANNKDIIMSTPKLLLSGYIRNQIGAINMASSDLCDLFENYMGNAENVLLNNNLILMTKFTNNIKFKSIPNNIDLPVVHSTKTPFQLFNDDNISPMLIAENVMVSVDNKDTITFNDQLQNSNPSFISCPSIPRVFRNQPVSRIVWTEHLDVPRKQLFRFGKKGGFSKYVIAKNDKKWEKIYNFDQYSWVDASVCSVSSNHIAVIDKDNNVFLYDCVDNYFVSLDPMNNSRRRCGSYYDKYTKKIIVFGGMEAESQFGSGSSMEFYDFYKNNWVQLPYNSNCKYEQHPCIWTIGGQCIFVAGLKYKWSNNKLVDIITLDTEWIDLRVSDKNGNNKSNWNTIKNTYTQQIMAPFRFCSLCWKRY